jgi:hypothetical protein
MCAGHDQRADAALRQHLHRRRERRGWLDRKDLTPFLRKYVVDGHGQPSRVACCISAWRGYQQLFEIIFYLPERIGNTEQRN